MIVENAVLPRSDQLQTLMALPGDGIIVMLNLLKFRERAEYGDADEPARSGAEAYALYGGPMQGVIASRGGRIVFSGRVDALVVGMVEDVWDLAVLVEYPSRAAFLEVITAPEVAGFHHHRAAGLSGQILLQVSERAAGS